MSGGHGFPFGLWLLWSRFLIPSLGNKRTISGQRKTGGTGVERGPLRAGLEFLYDFGVTALTQRVFLETGSGHLEFDTEVDWQHRHKFLKVEFPVDANAREATYEMPFGLARRPTTFNNSVEMAPFEVPGHRWADLSEPGFGAAIFTDSKYGYACHGNTLRLSLLRGPTDPDPEADRGRHHFRYAFYPHAGGIIEGEVVHRAHEFNQPFLVAGGDLPEGNLFSVDSPHLVIDTVKEAADSNRHGDAQIAGCEIQTLDQIPPQRR
ncbi:MAG: glycoside hydrolase family 38 C-terminal domain-containing protein [bacterium]